MRISSDTSAAYSAQWHSSGAPGVPYLVSYQYGGDSESGLGEEGSPSNWRCVDVGILRSVKLLEGVWKTASQKSLAIRI
jgi:hypothetical protein